MERNRPLACGLLFTCSPAQFGINDRCGRDRERSWCGWVRGIGNGEGGIRTPDDPEAIPVFETGAFNHSATSPAADSLGRQRRWLPKRGVGEGVRQRRCDRVSSDIMV